MGNDMEKKDKILAWIPLWIDKWLWGSTRIELKPDERSVFIDLLAFAAKDDGYIRANNQTPYLHQQLAGMFLIDEELLKRTIAKCIDVGKIIEKGNGIYYIASWDEYQFSDRWKRWLRKQKIIKDKITSAKTEATSSEAERKPYKTILYNTKLDNTKPKEIILPFNTQSFLEIWESFREHRKEIKKKMTIRSETMLLKKLKEMTADEAEAIKIIEQSIANGWQGLFEIKTNKRKNKFEWGND